MYATTTQTYIWKIMIVTVCFKKNVADVLAWMSINLHYIKEYILKDLSSVNENSTLRRVIRTMRLQRLSAIPVVNALGEYTGCITEKDRVCFWLYNIF